MKMKDSKDKPCKSNHYWQLMTISTNIVFKKRFRVCRDRLPFIRNSFKTQRKNWLLIAKITIHLNQIESLFRQS